MTQPVSEAEIQERLAKAGVSVREARISHLAYAPEIAGVMLRRQQANAIIAASTAPAKISVLSFIRRPRKM